MALKLAFPVKDAYPDADDVRATLSGIVVRDNTGLPRAGIFPPAATLLSSTATMNVSVAPFMGVAVRDGGVIWHANTEPTLVPIPAAPTTNSRIDVVYAVQHDASSTVTVPDANNLVLFDVMVGEPSATPVRLPGGLPEGALEIGEVLVPSTATATNSSGVILTDTFDYTCTAGGVIQFRTHTAMTEWATIRGSLKGQQGFVLTTNLGYSWSGTTWVPSSLPTTFPTVTAITGFTVQADNDFSVTGNRAFLALRIIKNTGVFASGVAIATLTVPPVKALNISCSFPGGAPNGQVAIDTAGLVTLFLTSGTPNEVFINGGYRVAVT